VFIGSINRHLRALLAQTAPRWSGLPIYVACSGNFTVERILARLGLGPLYGNDVSIYSCALGWYLAGAPQRRGVPKSGVPNRETSRLGSPQYFAIWGPRRNAVGDPGAPGQHELFAVRRDEYAWMEDYLTDPLATAATVMLAAEMFRLVGGARPENPYGRRILEAYRRRWPRLHQTTMEKIRRATKGVKLAEFYAGDCRHFVAQAPAEAVCVTFPPTYRGGYERIYRVLDEIFDWPRPSYDVFDPEDFATFAEAVSRHRHWLMASDRPPETLGPALSTRHVATLQTAPRSRPVYVYSDSAPVRWTRPHRRISPAPWPPRNDQVVWPVEIVLIDAATFRDIRERYLVGPIEACDAVRQYAVLSAGRLVGAFAFALPHGPLPCDLYLLSDFAVRPSPHRRLSKLILACVLSRELQADLEQWRAQRVRVVATTAFTDKPVSMKYRGLFRLHSRAEGRVNYLAELGRWSLREGWAWWKSRHCER